MGRSNVIDSALVKPLPQTSDHLILNVDVLSYAGNLEPLTQAKHHPRYSFAQTNIRNTAKIFAHLQQAQPDITIHLSAKSHVDRSIEGPAGFIQTSIVAPTPCWNNAATTRRTWIRSASITFAFIISLPMKHTAIWTILMRILPKPPPMLPAPLTPPARQALTI